MCTVRIMAAQKCFNVFPENKVAKGFYQALVLEVTTPKAVELNLASWTFMA